MSEFSIAMTKTEEKLYLKIAREMASGYYNCAALTKARGESGGDNLKLQGSYIKVRFAQLEEAAKGQTSSRSRLMVTSVLSVVGFTCAYIPGFTTDALALVGALWP